MDGRIKKILSIVLSKYSFLFDEKPEIIVTNEQEVFRKYAGEESRIDLNMFWDRKANKIVVYAAHDHEFVPDDRLEDYLAYLLLVEHGKVRPRQVAVKVVVEGDRAIGEGAETAITISDMLLPMAFAREYLDSIRERIPGDGYNALRRALRNVLYGTCTELIVGRLPKIVELVLLGKRMDTLLLTMNSLGYAILRTCREVEEIGTSTEAICNWIRNSIWYFVEPFRLLGVVEVNASDIGDDKCTIRVRFERKEGKKLPELFFI